MIRGSPLDKTNQIVSKEKSRSMPNVLSHGFHTDFRHCCAWIRPIGNFLRFDDVQLLLRVPQSIASIGMARGKIHALVVPTDRFDFLETTVKRTSSSSTVNNVLVCRCRFYHGYSMEDPSERSAYFCIRLIFYRHWLDAERSIGLDLDGRRVHCSSPQY